MFQSDNVRIITRWKRGFVTWTPLENGTVEQYWQSTTDGETWSDVFKGIYSLKPVEG